MLVASPQGQEGLERQDLRSRALQRLDVIDTPPENMFDMLTDIALASLRGETALMTLIDGERQFFKSAAGAMAEMVARRRDGPLTHSFCRFVVEGDNVVSIEDASRDPYLCKHPGYIENGVVSYLGAPIRVADAVPVGSLCIAGTASRIWTDDEAQLVSSLANFAGQLLQSRAELRTQDRLLDAVGGTPVFVTDASGRILFWSHDCERVLGWSAVEAIGQSASNLLGIEERREPTSPSSPLDSHSLRHRDGWHLRLKIRRTSVGADGSTGSVAHECVGQVSVDPQDTIESRLSRVWVEASHQTSPTGRNLANAIQILQSISDLVMK